MRYDQEGGLLKQYHLICPTSLQAHTRKMRYPGCLLPDYRILIENIKLQQQLRVRVQRHGRSHFRAKNTKLYISTFSVATNCTIYVYAHTYNRYVCLRTHWWKKRGQDSVYIHTDGRGGDRIVPAELSRVSRPHDYDLITWMILQIISWFEKKLKQM